MRVGIFISFVLLLAGAVQRQEVRLEVGSVLPAEYVARGKLRLYMTHSSQFRPFVEQKVGGVKYTIAYDEDTREIKYVSTRDRRFRTAGGLRVGSYIKVAGAEAEVYPGWEIRGPAGEDGWQPLIGFGSEMTILSGGRESTLRLPPGQYRLASEHPVTAKIRAFVKGDN